MSETANRVPSLAKLGKLANSRKFDALETAWLPAVASGAYMPEQLVPIAGQVGRLEARDQAIALAGILLGHLEESQGAAAALDAARLIALELPDARDLSSEIFRLYRQVHPDYPDLDLLLQRAAATRDSLADVVNHIDAYLPLRIGGFVKDPNYLVPGQIERVNVQNGIVTVLFDQRHQDYGWDTLSKFQLLPPDHFPALVHYHPERLRTLVSKDALAFITLALNSARERRLGYRDLKRYVSHLLGEKGWQTWWKQIRPRLKRADRIEITGGSQPTLILRQQVHTYEDRLRQKFNREQDATLRLEMVQSYLDETSGKIIAGDDQAEEAFAPSEELLIHFGNSAAKLAVACLADNPELSLAGLAMHAAVAAREVPVARPNPQAAAKVIGRLEDPATLAQKLPDSLLLPTLAYLRSALPERWPAVWAAVLTRGGRRICETVGRVLVEKGHLPELISSLEQVVAMPTSSPDAVCWLWRARLSTGLGRVLTGIPSLPGLDVLTSLLNLADATGKLAAVSSDDRYRRILDSVQQALAVREGQPIQEIFAGLAEEEARRLKALVVDNSGLSPGQRSQLLRLLRAEHAEIFAEDHRPWEDDLTYTTDVGLARRRAELDEILTVDIPAVARQIGEAAAFGDLSENSEYTAALEKRDQLTSRATGMEAELQTAKLITNEMATSDHVNIGCRVKVQSLPDDQEETYTFLGPWDADADQHILTYNAPLALAFMGKKVGDEVLYEQDGDLKQWRILAIEPAI